VAAKVPVGVIDEVAKIGDTVKTVIVSVVDGTNGGVGEKIAGGRDGETNGVVTAKGIFIPPQDTSRNASQAARIIFAIFTSDPGNCIGNSHQKHLHF
jgi:hypothetical protein